MPWIFVLGGSFPLPSLFLFLVDDSCDLCDFIGSGRLQAICKIVVINQNLPQILGEHLKKSQALKPPRNYLLGMAQEYPLPQATSKSHRIFAKMHEHTRIWTWLVLWSPDGIYGTRFHFFEKVFSSKIPGHDGFPWDWLILFIHMDSRFLMVNDVYKDTGTGVPGIRHW